MNIQPTNTPGPKYPVLTVVVAAAALVAPSCQQQNVQGPPGAPLIQVLPGKV